jgi:hypothetical protein
MLETVLEVFDCEQGTPEWRACRMGIPTASEFKSVMAQGGGKVRKAYMLKLLGERLTGEPMENFANAHTMRGHTLEDEARKLYISERWIDMRVHRTGFVRRAIPSVGLVGCSPDALVDDDGLIEIKTKLPHLQLEAILNGDCPAEHMAQCQGALWITGRKWLDFISYWPGLPLFVTRVLPELEYTAKLAAALSEFTAELDALEMNLMTLPRTPKIDYVATSNIFTSLE